MAHEAQCHIPLYLMGTLALHQWDFARSDGPCPGGFGMTELTFC